MVDSPEKRLRKLLFRLGEVETTAVAAKQPLAAGRIGALMERGRSLDLAQLLPEAREALEGTLLGERDLPSELIGEVLDALALVDEQLALLQGASEERST